MKTVLFTPGFGDDIRTRDYATLISAIKSKGYEVKFISINWKRTMINDWVKQLELEYRKHEPKNTILAGFSFGSMTSFVAATKRNPAQLWLFSFSPYFAEDLPKIKRWWANIIGKRRIEAFSRVSFKDLANKINCPTIIMVGEIETKQFALLTNRCKTAHKMITNSRLVIVPSARHDVTDKNYIETIKTNI